jgi:hypothetical protein
VSAQIIRCDKCLQPIMVLLAHADIVIEFRCIRDGVSSIHPVKVRAVDENGPVIGEWPDGIEVSPVVVFDKDRWERMLR